MTGKPELGGRADELMAALRRLRNLTTERDRLPFESGERSRVQDEIDATQQDAWRLASTWDERDSSVMTGARGSR